MQPAPNSPAELDELMTRPTEGVLSALQKSYGTFAVLGAGGKMGFHLAEMIRRGLDQLGRDTRVTVVSRFADANARRKFEQSKFDVVSADLSDSRQVDRLPNYDNVFFLAGVKFGTGDQPELLNQMNVVMPRLVANHYSRSRIVALSTGCVYSFTTPESGGSTEESETSPPGAYAVSCLGREAEFVQASRQHGTPVSLIRLNYSIDLRYGVLLDIAQKVWHQQALDVSMGYANVIWQGDAVARLIECLPHAASPPFIINITGPEILRVRDVAQRFGELLGRVPVIEGHEEPTAWLSNSALSTKLFGRPSVEVSQMIEWTAKWVRSGGETLNKPTHFETRDGDY